MNTAIFDTCLRTYTSSTGGFYMIIAHVFPNFVDHILNQYSSIEPNSIIHSYLNETIYDLSFKIIEIERIVYAYSVNNISWIFF